LNIPELIKEYLRGHDILTVPRLGSFTLQYKPSKINDFSQTMSPPSREIIFNSDSIDDDGTFTSFVAKHEGITLEEAKEQVVFYVNRVHELLQKGKFVQVSDIGMISKSADKLEFSALLRENLNKQSFGLTDISFDKTQSPEITTAHIQEVKQKKHEKEIGVEVKKPVEQIIKPAKPAKPTKVVKEKVKKEKSTRSPKAAYWLVAGAFTSVIAVLLFIFIFSDIPQNLGIPSFKTLVAKFTPAPKAIKVEESKPLVVDTVAKAPIKDTATLKPVVPESKPDTTAVKVAKVIDMQNCKEKALNPANDTKKNAPSLTGLRHYLIAGSFKNLINAQKLQADLKKKGYPAELVSDGRTFRISYKSFDAKEKANQEMQQMQQKGIAGIWVLSFEMK